MRLGEYLTHILDREGVGFVFGVLENLPST